jgi:murein DD-endopeptidase MepM/ murein hydrolase activator NlpD
LFAKNEFVPLEESAGAPGSALWLARAQEPVTNSSAKVIPLFGTRAAPSSAEPGWKDRVANWARDLDLTPDLGRNIGSVQWFRGAATCAGLCFVAISLRPDFSALPAAPQPVMTAANYDEVRSQMVTPLALGADSGRHMGPTDAVAPLAETPERPTLELSAAIGEGDSFARALSRAGVSSADSSAVISLLGSDVSLGSLEPGTRLDITLGRRTNRNMPRPLDSLSFRARLDLAIDVTRQNGVLSVHRSTIAVDNTPLRIRGVVTDSIYRAARAAGANPGTIQTFLRVIRQQVALGAISSGDRFDMIVEHRKAEDGEAETGDLLYGGVQFASGRKIDMLKWQHDGKTDWFEASGVGQKRPGLAKPVTAQRVSSGFGMRFHPLLGYSRMHAGIDFAASTGTPIYAVTDGRVVFAGRHGGHGNYVKLAHSGGLGTGYGHMSRIAVSAGESVRRGEIIGYVGSTGLSTGPHLHYEVYRNGQTVNPMSVKFEQSSQLSGGELAAFRARLSDLKRTALGPSVAVVPASMVRTQQDERSERPSRVASR